MVIYFNVAQMLVTKADDTVDYFAAKQYTKGAKEDEDEEEANIRLCREEMQRTMVAKQITETFCKEARKKNVAIHGMWSAIASLNSADFI
jgi:hypothetical protein